MNGRKTWHRQAKPLALALALALGVHGWLLLQALPGSLPTLSAPAPAAPLQLRVLTIAAPAPVQAHAQAHAQAAGPGPLAARPQAPATRTRSSAAAPAAAAPVAAPRTQAALDPLDPPAAPPLPAVASAAPVDWTYRLTQSGSRGLARLRWQPQGEHYSLSLERQLDGHAPTAWRSQGRLGPQGLSPERFASLQGGRERQATNFRRDAGLISYSSSTELPPLPAGCQDRLSAWLQLAAIADAAPGGLRIGQELQLPIAGLRGPVQGWRFLVRAVETTLLGDGEAIRTLRLEGRPDDRPEHRVELWLAPAQQHLPLRLRISWDGQERSELLLLNAGPKP